MESIGNIKYIESRFGGRNRNQARGKSAKATPHQDAADEKTGQSAGQLEEQETRLGGKVDISA